jgi:hypothetical protein
MFSLTRCRKTWGYTDAQLAGLLKQARQGGYYQQLPGGYSRKGQRRLLAAGRRHDNRRHGREEHPDRDGDTTNV